MDEETQAPPNVNEPDNKQVQAPSDNNQPKNPEENQPSEDQGIQLDDDSSKNEPKDDDGTPEAVKKLLEDSESKDGKEGDDKEGKPDESEAENPDDAAKNKDPKQESRERYLERQLGKRDEIIDTLTEQLQTNYIEKGEDDSDKRLRSLEAKEFVTQIREARSGLVSDNQRIASEIPMFNPEDKNYDVKGPDGVSNKDIHDRILSAYARDNVILRPIQLPDGKVSNEVVGFREPLYNYLKEAADLISYGRTLGSRSQQQAADTMAANAEVPGGAGPANRGGKSDKKDAFEQGMDSVEV